MHSDAGAVFIRGLKKSSNTPNLIKDAIIQRRPKKTQTMYVIPQITSSFKSTTISLIPETATITYKNEADWYNDTVAFVDSLGSVEKELSDRTRLEFWSPPVGRYRSGSGDDPEMIVWFRGDESLTTFKEAVEYSRDSFK